MSSRRDYVIEDEHTIARLSRTETEEVRVTRTRGTYNGRPFTSTAIRLYYRDAGGEWKPTKKGLSIRDHELRAVCAALGKALSKVEASAPQGCEDESHDSEGYPW